ncbi:MAG: tRNA lysidine(34) synthetase TilS [Clostridia bacterium]|nr:tRNA lysidine(34) synthetase TilS [Clostridia bacterium]
MRTKALAAIGRHNMIFPGDTVFVGLSGGADSVALTHFLYTVKDQMGFELRAVHINHKLRGKEADRDEMFVRDFCERFSIPLAVESRNVAGIAQKKGLSCEQAGREVRYEVFDRLCSEVEHGKIATAHTLSDLMETMIFNIARGCGIGGLCGIPAVRDNIIRPLIDCTREEIERYCEENNLSYVIDSTNLSDDFTRNKIRHAIIPALYEINPALDKTMRRLSSLAAQDEDFLSDLAQSALDSAKCSGGYSTEKLSPLSPSVLSRAIISASGISPSSRQVELLSQCVKVGSGSVQLGSDVVGTVACGKLSFAPPRKEPEKIPFWSVTLKDGTADLPDGRKIFLEDFSPEDALKAQKINKKLFINCICCDTINVNLTARIRKGGDTFSPAGRNCTKTLKKLFNEQGILADERWRRVLLEADGEIIWIEGLGASQKVYPDSKSVRVLLINITNNKNEDEPL